MQENKYRIISKEKIYSISIKKYKKYVFTSIKKYKKCIFHFNKKYKKYNCIPLIVPNVIYFL